MSLLAYNLTTVNITLAGTSVVVPAASAIGKRGKAFNITSEFSALTPVQFSALEAQAIVDAVVKVYYEWTGSAEEYETPGLTVAIPNGTPGAKGDKGDVGDSAADPGPDGILGTEDDAYPVLARTAIFNEPTEGEQGIERSIELMAVAPYNFRILQVFGAVSRGAPGAQMYICCHKSGVHEPHSDKFDASQVTQFSEQAVVHDRVIEEGEAVFAYCSSDYVRGNISFTYQRIS